MTSNRRHGLGRAAVALALVLVATVMPIAPRPAAAVPSLDPADGWVTNGRVWAIKRVGDKIYIGGKFNQVGPSTGYGVVVDAASGALATASPEVNGVVNAVIPDGSGGWYLGGLFSAVNGERRQNAAHVLADGTVGDWQPNPAGAVFAMARSGGTVFLGGDFTALRETAPRLRLGAVSATTGDPLRWRVDFDAPVRALAVDESSGALYVGGEFLSIEGMPRLRVAKVDVDTGTVDSAWNAATNGVVRALAVAGPAARGGARIYIGGDFVVAGGAVRNRLAALDPATGAALPEFTTGANGSVRALALLPAEGRVVAGGEFTAVGGIARAYMAELEYTGAVLGWNANASGPVDALATAPDGSAVYAGGRFTSVRGKVLYRGAKLSATGGAPDLAFNLGANRDVRAIAVGDGRVAFGGDFTSVNAVARKNLARLDAATGALDTSWEAPADREVRAMALSGDGRRLYLVGQFTRIKGVARGRGAAIDVATGSLTSWDPRADSNILSIATGGGQVYLGGQFSRLGNAATNKLGRVDAVTGAPDGLWLPSPNDKVHTITRNPVAGTVYVGGEFDVIGTMRRRYLAEIDGNGLATSWAPQVPHHLLTSALSADRTRFFAGVGGGDNGGNAVYSFDTTSAAEIWRLETTGDVQTFAFSLDGSILYVGGHFHRVQPDLRVRNHVMALYTADQVPDRLHPWAPAVDKFNLGVWDLEATTDGLLMAGDFRRIGTQVSEGFARFPGTP